MLEVATCAHELPRLQPNLDGSPIRATVRQESPHVHRVVELREPSIGHQDVEATSRGVGLGVVTVLEVRTLHDGRRWTTRSSVHDTNRNRLSSGVESLCGYLDMELSDAKSERRYDERSLDDACRRSDGLRNFEPVASLLDPDPCACAFDRTRWLMQPLGPKRDRGPYDPLLLDLDRDRVEHTERRR